MFEIGNSLREARERQGLTLADIERRTEIRSRYLKALEDENFSAMPALAYTRGFLRVYADELGLDGQLYVDEFNSRFSVTEEESARRQEGRKPAPHSRRIASGSVILALAVIAVLLALIFAAFSSGPSKAKAPSSPSTKNSAAKIVVLKVTAVRGDVSVEAHSGDRSGKLIYAGNLIKGHSKPLTAHNVWVKVSAAQNVLWKVLGGPPLNTRNRFGPATVLFTPSGHRFLTG